MHPSKRKYGVPEEKIILFQACQNARKFSKMANIINFIVKIEKEQIKHSQSLVFNQYPECLNSGELIVGRIVENDLIFFNQVDQIPLPELFTIELTIIPNTREVYILDYPAGGSETHNKVVITVQNNDNTGMVTSSVKTTLFLHPTEENLLQSIIAKFKRLVPNAQYRDSNASRPDSGASLSSDSSISDGSPNCTSPQNDDLAI